ncbi:two-partner secretion domain-containing protein [Campylobacter lari]|uniref:Hemagglutinin domain-containing protein n=1 Tax=Campylobacter lari NCTC 11845 TaxID=1388749 RepID=A0A0A8HV94_CAMLA|nr:filamentous hemagglutinin N-terminal domain-containing protein [Campylobacter lari]AJD01648.1 hemagglutinin domain-containing protein [Campylobacter lari NCTC 11845]EAK9955290.1 hemagglutination domain protein [Campylobacter lari]
MKKLANHIILSGVTVSMLFSPLMAIDPNKLPSGGKFTHGTSGTININGNNMDIMGNGKNSVIQWGGGFSIGNKAQVNFIGNDQNYLNIAHGTNKSTIEGVLNAGGNNVFLINPNGVIITKTGTINANRFVASTTSLQAQHFEEFKAQGASFSPVFNSHKAGNVVNMGNINANNVLLIGNKVSIDGGNIHGKHNEGVGDDALKNPSGNTANKVHLVGNEVNILVDGIKSDSIIASAYVKGSLQQSTTSYYNYDNNIGKLNFIAQEYDNIDKTNLGNKKLVTKDKFEKHATIGSDVDWWHFAKGWNENKNNMRVFFDTYKLVDDIDFGANCKNGVCSGQNYANYWVDLNCNGVKQDNEFTNMIVGYGGSFTKNFDGQGFTLKNINIDTTQLDNKSGNVGIFGSTINANFKNINVDYMGGGVKADNAFNVGGFVGLIQGRVSLSNISLNNISDISVNFGLGVSVGGFVGRSVDGYFKNISLDKINSIYNNSGIYHGEDGTLFIVGGIGGFVGSNNDGSYSHISINDIDKINGGSESWSEIGGFVGEDEGGSYSHISINDIDKISGGGNNNDVGGFVGRSVDGSFKNISLGEIIELTKGFQALGGFVGQSVDGSFSNISLNNIGNISNSIYSGGFIGWGSGYFNNISLNNIGNISGKASSGFIGKIYFGRVNANNIYIYFRPSAVIKSDEFQHGKFIGKFDYAGDITFSNIHIYHHEKDLTNATADQAYWNDFNKNGYVSDKINIHTYNDNTQESAYKDFLSKANTIEKPSKPTDPTDPNDSDVILGSDDLYSDVIMEWIIKEIREKNYTISIEKLASLINAFKTLDKDSSEDEIKTIVKAHLGIKDDNEALSMAQSISFLLNYQEHNFDGRLNKEALDAYNTTIKPNVNNTLGIISYLDKNKDELQKQYDEYLQIKNNFDKAHQAYKNSEAEFNRLLDLVNKGKVSYNDPRFTQAFDNWLNAYNEYNALSNDITKLNDNVLNIASGITDKDKGLGYTNFSFVKFDDITKIDLIKPEFPDIDNSQGGNLPDFEQTASLNLIGDKALDEEEETEEVEEASLNQKNKACIVSDNSKTMNPCIVGGL